MENLEIDEDMVEEMPLSVTVTEDKNSSNRNEKLEDENENLCDRAKNLQDEI